MRRAIVLSVVTVLCVTIIAPVYAVAAENAAAFGEQAPTVESDFNGDGFSDLAVGVPGEDLETVANAGVVQVLYGNGDGLTVDGNELWSQDTENDSVAIANQVEEEDGFGTAVGTGDLNRDGFADLIVGVPGEDMGATVNVGLVHVIYGSANGLTAIGNDVLTQDGDLDGTAINGTAAEFDRFGSQVAAGNVGKSAAEDLVVGVAGEDAGSQQGSGAVQIFYGTPEGITATGQQVWSQASTQDGVTIKGTQSINDGFGSTLTVGNFGKSGKEDLAVGVWQDEIAGQDDAGAVNVIYGAKNGLTAKGNQLWHQNSPDVKDEVALEEFFGVSVSAADFGRGQQMDLAIGVSGETVGGQEFAGAVHVLYGTNKGLRSKGNQMFHQNSQSGQAKIRETAEETDQFGSSVVGANFAGTGRADLAVGAPYDPTDNSSSPGTDIEEAGVIHVLLGGPDGLVIPGNKLIDQGLLGVQDNAEAGDRFGSELGTADFKGNGRSDLTVGIPREDTGGFEDAGAVQVFFGASNFDGSNSQFWDQGSPGMLGAAEEDDVFASAVTKP